MFVNILKKIVREFKRLKKHPAVTRFIKHNKKIFVHDLHNEQQKPIVLFELNSMCSAHIAYSYMANVLAMNNQFEIKCYDKNMYRSFVQKILFNIRNVVRHDEFSVYKSFGAIGFVEADLNYNQKKKAKKIFLDVIDRLKNKRDIEELTINNIWVGDLIYDTFLMTFKKPTIDIDSSEFKCFLLESIEFYVFWEDFLTNNDVRAVNVSHCVYNMAMPLRIAVQKNIPVFQTNASYIYRLSPKNLFAYSDFVYFRERFAVMPDEVKKKGIKEAEYRINRRFAGEVGVDMSYSTKSAYGNVRKPRVLKESSRKKILIATHCFFDSPHSYGNNIFPDFYEWLDFLGKMTEETDYDWYIKMHPDYLPANIEIINFFITKYPKFNLLPADVSHHQIIAEGISVALTVYGTIGFEYAALGIPVVNASQCNPHISYDFNIHAKDVEDYRRIIKELNQLKIKIDLGQVYEYYFMKNIYNTKNIFFENYDKTIDELGGVDQQFTPAIYDKWLDEWSWEKHRSIISALTFFIQSGDFRLDYFHYGHEFDVGSIGEKCN